MLNSAAKWIIIPVIAFNIILGASWILMRIFRRLAYCIKKIPDGCGESYACGEKNYNQMAQPDYSNIFPFAFFFTLAHVATLIMMTVPVESLVNFVMVIIYIVGAVLGLYILFRE